MSPVSDGFTPIRNGLLEHLRDGRLTLLEFAVYVLLHMRADWATGIYRGCALTLAYQAGDPGAKAQIMRALRRLKRKRYINYPRGQGARGGYDVLIHKFEPREGDLSGTRLNAWKHGDQCQPAYERARGQRPERDLSGSGGGPERDPNKETRSKNEETPAMNSFQTRTTEELKAMKKVIEQGTGKAAPEELVEELARRENREEAALAWQEIRALVAARMNPHTFDTWVKPTQGISAAAEALVVSVPGPEFARMLEKHRATIVTAMQELACPYATVRFQAVVAQIHAAEEPKPERRAGRVLVLSLLLAYHSYQRRLLRARLASGAARGFRLIWATINLRRLVTSFRDLTPREVRMLLDVITGVCEDGVRRGQRAGRRRIEKRAPRRTIERKVPRHLSRTAPRTGWVQ